MVYEGGGGEVLRGREGGAGAVLSDVCNVALVERGDPDSQLVAGASLLQDIDGRRGSVIT